MSRLMGNSCTHFFPLYMLSLAPRRYRHIFLQLCTGGDLFTYMTNHTETDNRLCEGEAKYIMYQLLKALTYLHNKMISHRGLYAAISFSSVVVDFLSRSV